MSSSASGAEDSAGQPRPTPESGPSQSEQTRDPDLLERVLRETSGIFGADEAVDEADSEALAEVARRHGGEPLTFEPIAVELVQAVLRSHFPAQSHSSQLWHALTAQIALTLFDDPVSRDRLEALWVRLGGGKS